MPLFHRASRPTPGFFTRFLSLFAHLGGEKRAKNPGVPWARFGGARRANLCLSGIFRPDLAKKGRKFCLSGMAALWIRGS